MLDKQKSLVWKLLIPVPVLFAACMLTAWWLIPHYIADNAQKSAVESAVQTVNQFKALRAYYTRNVIDKVLSSGNLRPAIDHSADDKVPLPATMIHDLSEILIDQNISIRLYSKYPFPNRADRKLDDFQLAAWDQLIKDPQNAFVKQQKEDKHEYIRVAIADKMVSEACVNCHNSHPLSPKVDWQLDDVRGILEVRQSIDYKLASGATLSNRMLLALFCVGTLISLLLALLVKRHVIQPLVLMTDSANKISDGDLNVRVVSTSSIETMQLANGFNHMAQSLLDKEESEKTHLLRLQEAADIKDEVDNLRHHVEKVAAGDLTNHLEASSNQDLAQLVINLNTMTEKIAGISTNILTAAEDMKKNVLCVEQAMIEQSENATNQMNMANRSTIALDHLTNSADQTSTLAVDLGQSAINTKTQSKEGLAAVQSAINAAESMRDETDEVSETIFTLSKSTQEIFSITDAVRELSRQLKVLALNAEIEAAKSGEAGKGFSVVAHEMRDLADQSEGETHKVNQILESILKLTDAAVTSSKRGSESVTFSINLIHDAGDAIKKLTDTINDATRTSDAIVSAVNKGTKDISDIRMEIIGLQKNTQQMVAATENALEATQDLRQTVNGLKQKVSVYRLNH